MKRNRTCTWCETLTNVESNIKTDVYQSATVCWSNLSTVFYRTSKKVATNDLYTSAICTAKHVFFLILFILHMHSIITRLQLSFVIRNLLYVHKYAMEDFAHFALGNHSVGSNGFWVVLSGFYAASINTKVHKTNHQISECQPRRSRNAMNCNFKVYAGICCDLVNRMPSTWFLHYIFIAFIVVRTLIFQ